MPGTSAVRQSLTPGEHELTIAPTEALGNYALQAGGKQERLDRGFSVNCPAEMSQLDADPGRSNRDGTGRRSRPRRADSSRD